jgi:hypothetical protein
MLIKIQEKKEKIIHHFVLEGTLTVREKGAKLELSQSLESWGLVWHEEGLSGSFLCGKEYSLYCIPY